MTNLMRWILANRRHLDISKILDEEIKDDFPIETTHLYYLPLGSFQAHGHMNYKIDRVSEDDINNAKATDNDVLQLFGIHRTRTSFYPFVQGKHSNVPRLMGPSHRRTISSIPSLVNSTTLISIWTHWTEQRFLPLSAT